MTSSTLRQVLRPGHHPGGELRQSRESVCSYEGTEGP